MSTHQSPATKPSSTLVFILYGVVALLLLSGGYLLYKNSQLNREHERELSTLRTTVQQNQLTNDRQQLTFAMKTFVWAVRNAMLQNKPGEVNEYFNTLVRNRGIREVLLVDPAGRVTISTNKKNQGSIFADRFPASLLQQENVYFNSQKPYELSAPVLAPNQRLGTLVMFYNPAPILPDSTTAR